MAQKCKCWFCTRKRGEHKPTPEFLAKSAESHRKSAIRAAAKT